MSRAEDKTFNTIRALSDKRAGKNQGSIITNGGLSVAKNIQCDEGLVVKGQTKLAGDVSIGGRLLCPSLYSVDEEMYRFKRNLVPALPCNSGLECDKLSLGTYREPWDLGFIKCIKSENIETSTIYAGMNQSGNPSFQVQPSEININNQLNIINPDTNIVILKTCGDAIEAFVPVYNQWNSVRAIELIYNPNEILHLTTSTILLNIDCANDLWLYFNADLVPVGTKVKTYFIRKKLATKVNYKLEVHRMNKKYIFTSIIPSKKISLFFLDNCVYLL